MPFDHAFANPSHGAMQPATANSLINIMQNAAVILYTINAPELSKTIQNYVYNAR